MFTFKKPSDATIDLEMPPTTVIHPAKSFEGKLRDQIFWSLGMRKPFIINDEYKIELLHIDFDLYRAKIKVTNLKNQQITESEMDFADHNGDEESDNNI
jgi:hypothetical protein